MEKEKESFELLKSVLECPSCGLVEHHPLVYCRVCGTLFRRVMMKNSEFKERYLSYFKEEGKWATVTNFNTRTGERKTPEEK